MPQVELTSAISLDLSRWRFAWVFDICHSSRRNAASNAMQLFSFDFAQALAKFARQQSDHFRRTVTLKAGALGQQTIYSKQ
jgi:hypothetical protein